LELLSPRVYAPVLTPFTPELAPDAARFVTFCRWLTAQGAGLAIFGTNSEANSLSLRERLTLLDKVIDGGIDPARLMPGTGACALPDAIELSRHALARGCSRVLVLPPFFYKAVDDDGLFDYYARLVDGVQSTALRLYLYHIPQVSGVAITHALIERLITRYPQNVVGIKDSSGDWSNTEKMLERFPDFEIFPASETLLSRALPLGAAGCISATANLQPGAIADYIARWRSPDAAAIAQRMEAVRATLQKYSMIAALKHVVAQFQDDPQWRVVRPPLRMLDDTTGRQVVDALRALGFDMAGLGRDGRKA
jgi:4-hydroxy-tetrahydrodipicolinate synthase